MAAMQPPRGVLLVSSVRNVCPASLLSSSMCQTSKIALMHLHAAKAVYPPPAQADCSLVHMKTLKLGKRVRKMELFSSESLNSPHRWNSGHYGHLSAGDLCSPQLCAHHSSPGPVLHAVLAVLALPRKFRSDNPPLWRSWSLSCYSFCAAAPSQPFHLLLSISHNSSLQDQVLISIPRLIRPDFEGKKWQEWSCHLQEEFLFRSAWFNGECVCRRISAHPCVVLCLFCFRRDCINTAVTIVTVLAQSWDGVRPPHHQTVNVSSKCEQ